MDMNGQRPKSERDEPQPSTMSVTTLPLLRRSRSARGAQDWARKRLQPLTWQDTHTRGRPCLPRSRWSAASVYQRDCRVTPEKNGAARRASAECREIAPSFARAVSPRDAAPRDKSITGRQWVLPRDTYARSRASDAEHNRALRPLIVIATIASCRDSSCPCVTLGRTLAQ